MRHTIRSGFAIWALASVVACASAHTTDTSSSEGPTTEDARVDPPRLLDHGSMPELRVPATASGRASVRVTMEVMVDAYGHADMSTFKLTGFGAGENKEALERWMTNVAFRPAQRDGAPVPARFHMQLMAKRVAQ
jgi:hypothetical protein